MFNFGQPKTAADWIIHVIGALIELFLIWWMLHYLLGIWSGTRSKAICLPRILLDPFVGYRLFDQVTASAFIATYVGYRVAFNQPV